MPRQPSLWPAALTSTLLAAFLFSACSQAPDQEGSAMDGGDPSGTGRTVTYRMPQDPPTLDPHDAADENSNLYAFNIFDGLVEFAPGSVEIAPAIAASWEVSEDGLTYTFHLREGVRFHDGSEVTADDIVYSLHRVLEKNRRSDPRDVLLNIAGAADWAQETADSVSGITSPDPRTIVLTLAEPASPLLSALATQAGSIVPRKVYDVEGDGYLRAPVGSGPFRLEEYVSGLRLSLAAFGDHWKGAPGVTGIRVRIIPDVLTALLEYETGEVDILNEVPSGRRREIREERPDEYKVAPRLCTAFILMNQFRGPFREHLALRQAVHHAVNRRRIVRDFQEDKDTEADGALPPGFGIVRAQVVSDPFDTERAAALLAEAGYPGGEGLPELSLMTPENEAIRNWAEAIQSDLKKAGFRVNIRSLAFGAYFEALMTARSAGPADDLAVLVWFAGYPDPEAMIQQLLHSDSDFNFYHYARPEVDALLDRAGAETSPARRLELYLEAERAVMEDAGVVPVYFQGDDLLVSPRIEGIHLSPLGDFAIPLELARVSR